MADKSPAENLSSPRQKGWVRFFPLLEWWAVYDREALTRDVRAGFMVAILLIPQAMAYALLANLSPKVGLWAAMAPPLVYALLGTSRYLAVGPVALVSLLVGQAVAEAAEVTGTPAHEVGLLLALLVGIILLVLGALRMGFLADFLSTPVLHGFAAAAALLIAGSQIGNLLGIEVSRSPSFPETLARIFGRLDQAHVPTLAMGACAVAILILARGPLKRWLERRGVPEIWCRWGVRFMPFLVVALGTLMVWRLGLSEVAVVGEADAGWPPLGWPSIGLRLLQELAPSALVISLVTFVTASAVARSLKQEQPRRVDPDQELLALGAAQVVASVTGGYPVGGSFSRSVVAFDSGAATPFHGIFTAALVTVAAIFAGPVFQFLPNTVLAALIIVAVTGLVDLRAVYRTWLYSRAEGTSMVVTFFAVIFLGVDAGLVLGVATGVGFYLWRISRPRVVSLGRVGESEQFRDVEQSGVEEPKESPVLVLRVDQDLFFANARRFRERVVEELANREDGGVVCLLLDLGAVDQMDSSALQVFEALLDELREVGLRLALADIRAPVMERLERVGFPRQFGRDRIFESVHEGLEVLETRYG